MSRTTTEMRISEVEIISMLTPASASASKKSPTPRGGTACRRRPATPCRSARRRAASSKPTGLRCVQRRHRRSGRRFGRVKEMSVRPVAAAETFCTIMSMLISASATARKIAAALPGMSGTPTTVIFASLRSCATPEMMGCSNGLIPSGVMVVPGSLDSRTRSGRDELHVVAPGVLHAPQVQDVRAAGGQLEHLLVGDVRQLPRGRHDAGVGAEDAVDVGVDLADLGAQRCGERDGRRVGPAAAERGDVIAVPA